MAVTARKPESGLTKALRTILSFILAGVIAILCVGACFAFSFLNSDNIEKRFTCYEYVCGLRENMLTYAENIYEKNGLDKSDLEDIITYDAVSEAADNYAGRYIGERVGYDDDLYITSVENISSLIGDDIADKAKQSGQSADSATVSQLEGKIKDYFVDEIDVPGISKLETVFNVGITASYAVIGVSAFFFIFITAILFFLGEKRYRSIRAISISFMTAGIFQGCLALIVLVISKVKKFDIYPIYLLDQFTEYIADCIGVIAISGFACAFIAIAAAVFAWNNKIKGKR